MLMPALTFLIAISLVQCGSVSAYSKGITSSSQRLGSRWEVVSINQVRAPTRSKSPVATLFLEADGAVAGTWECNSGGSPYVRWSKDSSFIGAGRPIIFTTAGCRDQDQTDFAGKFWRFFGKAKSWQRESKILVIHASDGGTARLRLMSESL